MSATYTENAYVVDPSLDPTKENPFAVSVEPITLTDHNADGVIDDQDTVGGIDILGVYVGDWMRVNGEIVTGATLILSDGTGRFLALDGTTLEDGLVDDWYRGDATSPLDLGDPHPPCFVAGTTIATPNGPVPVEDLRPGDLVQTADDGAQPLIWSGSKTTMGTGRFAPVCFRAAATGGSRDLYVSQHHRMLLSGGGIELYFEDAEWLAPARHLANGSTASLVPRKQVEYVHLMFDRHQVIFAEGIPTESFFPGDQILSVDADLRAELYALFPELEDDVVTGRLAVSRPVMRRHEAALWARTRNDASTTAIAANAHLA